MLAEWIFDPVSGLAGNAIRKECKQSKDVNRTAGAVWMASNITLVYVGPLIHQTHVMVCNYL